MKILIRIGLLLTLFGIAWSCSQEEFIEKGQGIVKGRVVESETYTPIANARVSSSPSTSTVFTDSLGYYTVTQVNEGDYSFEARKDGYIAKFEAVHVNTGGTTEMVFELVKQQENNLPPTVPVLTTPSDNAMDQSLEVTLKWTCTDPEDDALTYKVTLRNDTSNNVVTYDNITTTSFTLTNLNYSTKYYWQVTANDGINPDVNSLTSSFRTLMFPNARYLFVRKAGDNNVIFTADDSGNELQITSDATNSFRPRKNTQANKIAFIRTTGGQGHIYTMKPDGSSEFKVTSNVPVAGFNLDYYNYCWRANGSQLIYSNFDKLYRINADGSGLIQLYQTPTGKFISECDWSYDGSRIALKVNDLSGYNVEIYVIDMSGNVVANVLSGVNGAAGGLHLSVNNTKLVFTRDVSGYQSSDYRQLDNRIFMYDFTTNATTEVAVQRPAGYNDLDVRFSPNEAELIFVSTSNDGVSPRTITKYTMGTSNSRTTLFSNGVMPDWK
ncbi:MAG TPA: carboxypeptidase regulatory-like domain-containing protein [Flavobacterium sp.]|nr:carboxypeptidase regulatory-like domain-containing protein [Flavobacterium sp.]